MTKQAMGRKLEYRPPTVVLSARITPESMDRLRDVSAQETRSISNMTNILIQEALEQRGLEGK